MRSILLISLKLLLVAGLLYWLVAGGKLDFNELRRLVNEPDIFFANLAVWGLGYVVLGTARWCLLLRGLDLEMGYARALRLQLIGFFFNTAMPGAVGGDIVKAVYVIREQHTQRKTPAMVTVLLDRVMGLAALFVLAGVAVASNASFFTSKPALAPLVVFVVVGLFALLVGFGIVMFPFAPGRDPFERLLRRKLPGFAQLHKIYGAVRAYRERPQILLGAVAISIVIQGGSLAYAMLLTERLTGKTPDLGVFGTIFPIGIMTTALPLAPGGLGVGHVAFDRLYTMVGLDHGANVFNLMVLGTLALNLLGFIPYLLHRTRLPAIGELQAELEQVAEG